VCVTFCNVTFYALETDRNLEQMKLFNARRKLRAAIRSVMVANRMAEATNTLIWH
jgi:hypothetical protein